MDLDKFTEEIVNRKLHFLCSVQIQNVDIEPVFHFLSSGRRKCFSGKHKKFFSLARKSALSSDCKKFFSL